MCVWLCCFPSFCLGPFPEFSESQFIEAFETGFGRTLGKIGVIIFLGSMMAEALRHTGAIQVITRSMIRLVGAARMPLALTLTGFIVGIAIFSDVAYVILNPLVHASAKGHGRGYRRHVDRAGGRSTACPCHCSADAGSTGRCCSAGC